MKNPFRMALVSAVLTALAAFPAAAGTTYGKGVSAAKSVALADLMAKPSDYVGKSVKVEGLVADVCSERGCWIEVKGERDARSIKVKVEDGVIVFPVTAKGKKVVAEGILKKIELTKEKAVERLRHEAEEKGTKFDPASVTGPMTIYQIQGTGAVVD